MSVSKVCVCVRKKKEDEERDRERAFCEQWPGNEITEFCYDDFSCKHFWPRTAASFFVHKAHTQSLFFFVSFVTIESLVAFIVQIASKSGSDLSVAATVVCQQEWKYILCFIVCQC